MSDAQPPPEDSLPGRLIARRTALGLARRELARRAGVGSTYVRDIEEGRSVDPRDAQLRRIATALGLHVDWLRHGTGPRLLGLYDEGDPEIGGFGAVQFARGPELMGPPLMEPPAPRPTRSGEIVMLPVLRAGLSAGGGAVPEREDAREWWPLPHALVVGILGVQPSQADIVFTDGDSMSPTLKHGDPAIVDRTDRAIAGGGVFAVWDGDGLVVKRLQVLRGAPGAAVRLRFVSDNAAYPPYERDAEWVTVIGRVKGAITRP